MNIHTNGISYNVDIHQQKATFSNFILLHGFMGSGRVFFSLINYLKTFCNPITIDLLGHGHTGGAESDERFASKYQLNDLDQIISEICDEPPFLHGYSMGGRLALRYALLHQPKLSGLILESTNTGIADERKQKQRRQIDEERAKAIINEYNQFIDDWQKLSLFQRGMTVPDTKMKAYQLIQRKQRPEQMAHSLRGFGTAQMDSIKKKLTELTLPVLLLAGQADLKYAEIARQTHKKVLNSTLTIVQDAGHRIHLEHPKALVSEVQSFILKNN